MIRQLLQGAAAGAAGTSALYAATYTDMAWRGRPASTTPQDSISRLADKAGVHIPGEGAVREARLEALGALAGIATGVAVGAAYGMARGLGLRLPTWAGALALTGGALVAANGPMTVLGVTDPRTWGAADWLSDLVPHLAYGAVTAATYAAGERDARLR